MPNDDDDDDGIAHIPKPQDPDRFEAWCGERLGGFTLTSLDHAANCLIVGSYVQPCPRCVEKAVAFLMGKEEYVPSKNPAHPRRE
jgi:hypothetical protein